MKSILKMIITIALLSLFSACITTSPLVIPEKYNLDGQLKRVDKVEDVRVGRTKPAFTKFNEFGEAAADVISRRDTVTLSVAQKQWIKVDEQSIILRGGSKEYYLLVLDKPVMGLMGMDSISFTLMQNIITAKKDFIQVGNIKYFIDRIYIIDGVKNMASVRAHLIKGNKK